MPASESALRADTPAYTPPPVEPASGAPADAAEQAPEAAEKSAADTPEPAIGEAGPPPAPRGGWWLSRRRKGSVDASEPSRWD